MLPRRALSLEESLFWEIYDQPLSLRSALGKRVGASRATVCRAVAVLLDRGLVVEAPTVKGLRGRRPRALQPNAQLAALLGIDIQVGRVTAAVTDLMGGLLGRSSLKCDAREGAPATLAASRSASKGALADAGLARHRIRHLGAGFSGELDPETGACVSWLNAPLWKGVPLRRMLEDAFRLDVTLGGRGSALAVGERRTSPGDWQHPNALYIICSDGIGLGIFIDGHLYHGANDAAGEIGHTVVDSQGPTCRCGRIGCVEATAGVLSIIRDVQAALRTGKVSALPCSAVHRLTIEQVVSAAYNGDDLATGAIRRAAAALGTGIVNAVNLLNPSLVVLCGELARVAGPEILNAAKRALDSQCIATVSKAVQIRIAIPKKDVAAIGCALLAADAAAERELRIRLP